ncbi:MAG TPA: hypothetical protein VN132_02015, partial [Bdellovibrio sp.]|nr:hypothetical protein [Bdellovibrio sp.]
MKSFILSSLIVFSSATGFAQNTSQLGYFEKLSKALRGMPPSMDEREEFKKAETLNQTDTFTQKKVAEYLTSQTFQYRMKVRVDEYFRLKADSNPLNV